MLKTYKLNSSLSQTDLANYVAKQIDNVFPDGLMIDRAKMTEWVEKTFQKIHYCFSHIKTKYYFDGQAILFNHLNGDHYAFFLYWLSRFSYEDGNEKIASKFFLLNKYMHGIDAFYGIKLPDIFMFVHPLGTILGNGTYQNYLIIYQNCTIGATHQGIYPSFGEKTILYAKTSVIGNCVLGNNVILGSNSSIINTNIPADSVVLGTHPNHRFLPNNSSIINSIFDIQTS